MEEYIDSPQQPENNGVMGGGFVSVVGEASGWKSHVIFQPIQKTAIHTHSRLTGRKEHQIDRLNPTQAAKKSNYLKYIWDILNK